MLKRLLILLILLNLTMPLYAQKEIELNKEAEVSTPALTKKKTIKAFFDFIDKKVYAATIDKKEEKRILREKWKKLLGIDIFYPYFKAKKVEKWVRDKASMKIFNIKGRPKFDNNQIKYTFTVKF